ncbi:MAG: methyltransferase [Gammaproteobacteria bacterium]|nr:methyltransferase [Gammaproteobacteria bacterium]MYD77167.1 methyltransferase [Gammaproteobacteria bacterium]MYJ53170.1 methyltransferase [Gammaproteobacteria bacterium]
MTQQILARTGRRRNRAGSGSSEQGTPDTPSAGPGMQSGCFKPLSADEQAMVHEAALDLLETLGISQAIPSLVERVAARGGRLDDEGRLRFPRRLVEEAISSIRRDVHLHNRSEIPSLELTGYRVHFGSGGAAPNIVDFKTGRYRPSTARDLYDAARLVDTLEHIHVFSRSLVATDAPDSRSLDVNTAYAVLSGTSKHTCISCTEVSSVPHVANLCYAVAGGEAAFRARPFMTLMIAHVVPPMRFAREACEVLESAVLSGFPIQVISAGQAGATSPATLAGSLTQAVAESLAGMVFAWLVNPDAMVVFAPKPLVADLRTGAMSGGGGEQAILMAAAAQMGRYYDFPTSSIAGITDSKIPDAQHGAEKCLSVSLAAHAGSNLVTQSCGMQASLLGCALESYVIDNDMLGNIMRSVRGVEAAPETIATDVIAEVCRGEGHYLGHPQTLENMKSHYSYPALGDRRTPREWEESGANDIRAVARRQAAEILRDHFPAHIDDTVDLDLRQRFDLLLSREETGRET